MRILLVSDGYPPVAGGLEAHVERLARYLSGAGHTVTVVTATGGDGNGHPGEVVVSATALARVPGVHRNGAKRLPPPWPDPVMMAAITRAAETHDPDVIHAHGWCAASAGVVARRRGVPLVVTLHDYGLLCPMRTLLNGGTMCPHTAGARCVRCPGSDQSVPKRLGLAAGITLTNRFSRADPSYLAVSHAVADTHRRAGLPGPIEVVPNFIDEPDRPPSAPPGNGPILFVGPGSEAKGLDVLREAHRLLLARGRTLTLHHVGGTVGPSLGAVVESGHLHGADLEKAFRQARVVAVPSTWQEPCPTVALEAMAAGRAVVASAVGGLLDIVDPGVTGVLVPPHDPAALADALDTLLGDPQGLAAMGRAGYLRLGDFSTATVGPRIEAAYEAACHVRPALS